MNNSTLCHSRLRHITMSFVGVFTVLSLKSHDFQDIDLSKYSRIDLKPKCVEISYQYAHDSADITHKTNAILLPYKQKEEVPDGWGGSIHVWYSRNSGPAVELRKGIFNARKNYTAMLTAAGLEKTLSLESAVGSYVAGIIGCLANAAAGSDDYTECEEARLEEFMEAKNKLEATYEKRLTNAILTCDTTIDSFLAAYQGCDGLDALVELWEEYWNELILK